MNESCSPGRILVVFRLLFALAGALSTIAGAHDLPRSPGSGSPSQDCGCHRGNEAVQVSSGMLSPFLPKIPNLELGFLYSFGNNVSAGRFTADYLLPFRLGPDSVLFGEAHAEGWDFRKRPPSNSVIDPAGFTNTTSAASNRIDLSFGGGYRTMVGANNLVGVNGFYDASRLFNTWYSSGGVGLEYAANPVGDDAIDLNLNWYGNLFNRDVLVNTFRNKGNSFDVEAGYSHALLDRSLDLRLSLSGYQFDVGDNAYGWRGGADLTTRDGVFTLRYEYGHDRINGDYNTVGGFLNVGFDLENALHGGNPFILPEPVFRSPRNLGRLLGMKAKRNWHQASAAVVASGKECLLTGCVVYTTHIDADIQRLYPQPPVPDLSNAVSITVCWCGLNRQKRVGVLLDAFDGLGHVATSDFFRVEGASGCATVPLVVTQTIVTTNFIDFSAGGAMEFFPGGGVSFTFNR